MPIYTQYVSHQVFLSRGWKTPAAFCGSRNDQYFIRYHDHLQTQGTPVSEINDAMRDMLQRRNRTDVEQESITECKAIWSE